MIDMRVDTVPVPGSLKRWCGAKPENMVEEVARFENMILAEGARLKDVGEKGLEILPGVQTLLDSVCGAWQVKDLADGRERRYRKMRGRS
jgi:hypothetical protein